MHGHCATPSPHSTPLHADHQRTFITGQSGPPHVGLVAQMRKISHGSRFFYSVRLIRRRVLHDGPLSVSYKSPHKHGARDRRQWATEHRSTRIQEPKTTQGVRVIESCVASGDVIVLIVRGGRSRFRTRKRTIYFKRHSVDQTRSGTQPTTSTSQRGCNSLLARVHFNRDHIRECSVRSAVATPNSPGISHEAVRGPLESCQELRRTLGSPRRDTHAEDGSGDQSSPDTVLSSRCQFIPLCLGGRARRTYRDSLFCTLQRAGHPVALTGYQ